MTLIDLFYSSFNEIESKIQDVKYYIFDIKVDLLILVLNIDLDKVKVKKYQHRK